MLSQSCCSLVEYTKVWSQERNLKSNYGNKQLAQEILPVRDSFGVLGILEWPRSTFRFRCSSCSDPNFPSGSALKNLPAMQELQVQSLVREDTLEEGMATHSSTLGQENPMGREAWQATVHGVPESDMTWQLNNNSHIKDPKTLTPDAIVLFL